ncbi:MAG: thioredoxin reductase [bacterium]|nr:MAG: thioredoxin reductase [bacterium]
MAEKLVIIGSGPAGWTASIYAARAHLDPLLYEGGASQYLIPGGQLMFTTEVENYPGFPEGINGPDLMDAMRAQAERFNVRTIMADIVEVDFKVRPFRLKDSEGKEIETHTVIIATGARANWLGLENEQRLAKSGGGVSACAVCDGALPVYRDKVLAVVGGGDTAIEEANYLTKFASQVYIVHRRDELRATKAMQDHVKNNPKIVFDWNKVVTDVLGDDMITGLRLKDTINGNESNLDVQGMFVAIGHTPNTDFLKGHLDIDNVGYIKITESFRMNTSVEGVFAAGDVMDSYYRQAITSAGTGCMAALDAERWLTSKGL